MSAVEEIQQAIATLERLRAESTPGPWRATANNRRSGTHAIYGELPGQEVVGATPNYGGLWLFADAELIVTLHRTIDAQLAILRQSVVALGPTNLNVIVGQEPFAEPNVLALTRAINGGVS